LPFFQIRSENPPAGCPYNRGTNFFLLFLEKEQLMDNHTAPSSLGRRYFMAVVLGTTLSALGSAPGQATAANSETTVRAVHDISRYCTTCWRNARLHPDCWTDCTQEVFSRLMERVTPDAWNRVLKVEGEERREFMRAIDAVKKRTQRRRKFSSGLAELVPDRRDLHERQVADEREAVRLAAEELLSSRQQRILQLSFEGWSVQDIAEEMQVPAERVSDEKYKAIKKLRGHLGQKE
jgi:RNA polymerase sigma factor (sigma-70 family)